MDLYGVHSESTVWEGCRTLFQRGETLVAIVVFLASLVIPFLKLLGLFFLVVTVSGGADHPGLEQLRPEPGLGRVRRPPMTDVAEEAPPERAAPEAVLPRAGVRHPGGCRRSSREGDDGLSTARQAAEGMARLEAQGRHPTGRRA